MTEKTFCKTYDAASVTVEEGNREVLAVISTDTVDRQNEVVIPTGLIRKQYGGSSVFYNHAPLTGDFQALPIGKALWIKAAIDPTDGREKLFAKLKLTDKTAFARDIFALLQEGTLNSFSISFTASNSSPPSAAELKARPDWKSARRIIREWELMETSVVGIPANPEALALAVSKGVITADTVKLLNTKPEEVPQNPLPPIVDIPVKSAAFCEASLRKAFYQAIIDQLTEAAKR